MIENSDNLYNTIVSTSNGTSPNEVVSTCATAPSVVSVESQPRVTTAGVATALTQTNGSDNSSTDRLIHSEWPGSIEAGISSARLWANPKNFGQTLPTYVNTTTATYGAPESLFYVGPNMTSTQVNQITPGFGQLASNGISNNASTLPMSNANIPGSIWFPSIQTNVGATQYSTVYGQAQSGTQNGLFSATQPTCRPPPTYNVERPSLNFNQTDNLYTNITLSPSQVASRQVLSKELPVFSGNPDEWPLFITNFEQSTERCGFSNQENLIRLQRCLKGSALEAVRGKLMMPSTVPLVIETLKMLFGRPDVIHESLQRRLRQLAPVRIDRLETLINFSLAVQNYRATMQAIGLNDYLNDPMLLNDLLGKLPGEMKLDWGRRRLAVHRVDIIVFDEWLYNLAICASQVTPISSTLAAAAEEKSCRKHYKERVLLHDAEIIKRVLPSPTCAKCANNHRLQDCPEFVSMSRQDRWQLVKDKKLCIRCFKNHMVRRCNSQRNCGVDGCRMAHNPLLHSQKSTSTEANTNNSLTRQSSSTGGPTHSSTILLHSKEKRNVLFRYVPVTLHGNGKIIKTLALIDEGSSISLIDSTIADQLGVDGPSEELCMKWTGGITQQELSSKYVSLNISSQDINTTKYRLRNVRTISNMNLPRQSLDISTIKNRPHLRSLPIQPYGPTRPLILIGLDNVKLIAPLEIIEHDYDGLIATRCRIGWSVYGRNNSDRAVAERLLHICDCSKDARLDEMMRHYFSIESVGTSPTGKHLLSKEDERSLNIMESTTRFLESEKRWETGLLWKYDKIELPNSLHMARKRLECLENKMMKDPELKKFIICKLSDYVDRGYIKKLSPNDVLANGKSWYIPIFVVTNYNKNKKRLVWDAAAKVKDVALNSVLLKGPDLLRSLVGVLIRFRERPVAICGDIREMFHQVRIIKGDQVAQRFLWRNCESFREPDIYAMTVMTFGASCSPSLANYVKNKNAERFEANFPQAVAAIKQNTFVDDWLQSADSEEEMIELSANVKHIHSEGGFEMRNWISNSKAVLAALNGNSSSTNKCITEPDSQYEKVLGLWWLPESDEFTFVHKFKEDVFNKSTYPMKRQILRYVMTIFDPLGLLGFFVVQAKIILQDIWRSGVSWDEPILDNERKSWWQWIGKLKNMHLIKIPRCFHLVSRSEHNELHVFVDASIQAYAAVAYIKANVGDEVVSSIVASKTRVAPLKPISVPRMELMAAILGLRLAKFIQSEVSVHLSRRVFWTDSKDVLYWIRSDARKFHQFVAVRIGEILEESCADEWRWVPSLENVADDGTKVNNKNELQNNIRWFSGPQFLCLPESEWPQCNLQRPAEETVHHIDVQSLHNNWQIVPDLSKFNKWEKLRRCQMYVLRFLSKLKTYAQNPQLKNALNTTFNNTAETVLFRHCQREAFSEEILQLQTGFGMVSRKSLIYKYSPYTDESGVLRVKGRIDAADVPYDVKRPIILPRNHPITYLITDFYHRKFHHHHNEIVINEMRQRFCIRGMRALVRETTRTCQYCRNRRASPSPPEMGNLPQERLAAFTRPFTFTGVDYFGPLEVVVGRRREKRWGVLFTCMTIRAVHIEISPSLSTDSFLLVLKQFIARRGVPQRIYSDNATNFRGASRILIDEIEKVSYDIVERRYPEIQWSFIPPASPHMGGAWERMIRSVKSILFDILPQERLREEVLRATLADIENIINMRPLTYIPLESFENEALTPNHFLLGNSSGLREKGNLECSGTTLGRNFRIAGNLADTFWKRWVRECLPCLTRRSKWFEKNPEPIAVNDVVIIVDDNSKRNTWTKAKVIDVIRAKDGHIRSAVVKTSNGICTRPVVKLARLDLNGVNPTSEHGIYGGGNVKERNNPHPE